MREHDWLQQEDAERKRNWVSVGKEGAVETMAMSKYDVSYYAGIPFRDLLILDPLRPVPYYAAIFLRPPGAIVVSLEHMRLVICNEKALILNAEEPRVAHFVAELSVRLAGGGSGVGASSAAGARGEGEDEEKASVNSFVRNLGNYPAEEAPPYPASPTGLENLPDQAKAMLAPPRMSKAGATAGSFANLAQAASNPMLELPFELRVLECVLKEVCERLDYETRELDEELTPSLESLARNVRFKSLQRVRRLKSKMNRLMTRVDDVRDELRKILSDDGDMRDMCLTTKAALATHQEQEEPGEQGEGAGPFPSVEPHQGQGEATSSTTTGDPEKALRKDLEEERESVEALLEAFFIHSEQSKKRLAIMREAVNDTEDMNELNLDQIRNELFRVEVTVTNATFATGLLGAVAGVFGMNLRNSWEDSHVAFILVVVVTVVVSVISFVGIHLYLRRYI